MKRQHHQPLKLSFYILTLALSVSQTACLKTRAQLKSEQGQSHEQPGGNDTGAADKSGPAKPSLSEELEMLKNEVTRVSGKIDELEHQSHQQNYAELKEFLARVDSRVADLEKNQILVMSELKALKDKEAEKEASVREAARPAGDLLSEANKLLGEKKCDEAADKFRTLLSKGIKGKEAAEAHYGLGESNFCQKDYKKAIVQYSKVQEAFMKSPRVPASLYRIGLAFQHLNMTKESKGFFSELVERYPNSPEAKKARAKVKE